MRKTIVLVIITLAMSGCAAPKYFDSPLIKDPDIAFNFLAHQIKNKSEADFDRFVLDWVKSPYSGVSDYYNNREQTGLSTDAIIENVRNGILEDIEGFDPKSIYRDHNEIKLEWYSKENKYFATPSMRYSRSWKNKPRNFNGQAPMRKTVNHFDVDSGTVYVTPESALRFKNLQKDKKAEIWFTFEIDQCDYDPKYFTIDCETKVHDAYLSASYIDCPNNQDCKINQ